MKYRPEIDGLRAIAVIPVILFHAGLSVFSGGYVGVDVFFVISGYLITTILLDERSRGIYSLLGFYERRARRILPAIFVVFVVCLPIAWMRMPPYILEDFARSMAFAALFFSNVHFWEHTDYFALDAELQPLLHTWSLAVEEQFYLLFPLLLLLLGAFARKRYLFVLGMIAFASLLISEWGWRNHREENFFFTFSRFWELFAGSICAVLLFNRPIKSSDSLAALGLGMILYAIFAYDTYVPFPSVYTLVPVVGTSLIVLFGTRTITAKLLSTGILVGIGLISYSAYLWHQPLFSFARIWWPVQLPSGILVGFVFLSLGLAYLTWRFVEQPFRRREKRLLASRRRMLGASVAGIAIFASLGFYGVAEEGFPSRLEQRMTPFYQSLLDTITPRWFPVDEACTFEKSGSTGRLCVSHDAEKPQREFAVIGDSHVQALLPAFSAVADAFNATVLVGVRLGGCAPLLKVDVYDKLRTKNQDCIDINRANAEALTNRGISTVFLVARWTLYTFGDYSGDGLRALQITGEEPRWEPHTSQRAFQKGLRETIAYYRDAGINVVIVQQVPEQQYDLRRLVEHAVLSRMSPDEAATVFESSFVKRQDHEALQFPTRRLIEGMIGSGVAVVSLDKVFETEGGYKWLQDGVSLYYDEDHLSVRGAQYAKEHFVRELSKVFASSK